MDVAFIRRPPSNEKPPNTLRHFCSVFATPHRPLRSQWTPWIIVYSVNVLAFRLPGLFLVLTDDFLSSRVLEDQDFARVYHSSRCPLSPAYPLAYTLPSQVLDQIPLGFISGRPEGWHVDFSHHFHSTCQFLTVDVLTALATDPTRIIPLIPRIISKISGPAIISGPNVRTHSNFLRLTFELTLFL